MGLLVEEDGILVVASGEEWPLSEDDLRELRLAGQRGTSTYALLGVELFEI